MEEWQNVLFFLGNFSRKWKNCIEKRPNNFFSINFPRENENTALQKLAKSSSLGNFPNRKKNRIEKWQNNILQGNFSRNWKNRFQKWQNNFFLCFFSERVEKKSKKTRTNRWRSTIQKFLSIRSTREMIDLIDHGSIITSRSTNQNQHSLLKSFESFFSLVINRWP